MSDVASEGFVRVAALGDLDEGTMLGVMTPAGERICLIRDGDEVRAVGDECPHQGFALSAGELCGDGTIECVWHGARFDLRTGVVKPRPAEEGLARFAVRVEGEEIWVGGKLG